MNLQISVPFVPASAPFNAQQRAWLNGYFAGLTSFSTPALESLTPATAVKKPLLVLYGSQTGTAEGLAKKFAKEAAQQAFEAKVLEANACSLDALVKAERLVFITSTWGDGDPPDNATQFFAALQSPEASKLETLSYSVLALGDKNYSDFCGREKKRTNDWRNWARGGCIRGSIAIWITNRQRRDGWRQCFRCSGSLERSRRRPSLPIRSKKLSRNMDEKSDSLVFSRKNPFPARLLANRLLTGEGSAKEVRHFAISLEGSGITYEAGDALGIFPANCPALVSDILAALGCDGEEGVKTPDGSETSFRNALLRHYDITQPVSSLLEAIAERAQSAELKTLLAPANKAALEKHLHGREVIDFLIAHPLARFTPAEFVELLKKLNPRRYSIASSPKAHPGEVHLCVGIVRYEAPGRGRKGVCSSFLADAWKAAQHCRCLKCSAPTATTPPQAASDSRLHSRRSTPSTAGPTCSSRRRRRDCAMLTASFK
ncbi:MAG TPA: sulfite reductase flavoprotein subunit alpha [Candidatus Limnocylindria bacterium]|nr:sulfite reductase flavoprotein subunit alpha [Candidatus Limnocylindria bacterium]